MGTDDDLADLRRRAFSRAGTPDDLRRLAELEGPPSADSQSRLEAVPAAPSDPANDGEAPAAVTLPPPRRRGILIAGLVGIALGATIATLGIQLSPRAQPQPLARLAERSG